MADGRWRNRGSRTADAPRSCMRAGHSRGGDGLQIVDNLQSARLLMSRQSSIPAMITKWLPADRPASARSSCSQSIPHDAGAARAEASHPRRRPRARRDKLERGGDRCGELNVSRGPVREAFPRARIVGPRAHREEPRRLRAPGLARGSRQRSTRCAPVWTSVIAGSPQRASSRRKSAQLRGAAEGCSRPRAQQRRGRLLPAERPASTTAWPSSPATARCSATYRPPR